MMATHTLKNVLDSVSPNESPFTPERIWELLKMQNPKFDDLPEVMRECWEKNANYAKELTLITQDAKKPIFERMLTDSKKSGACPLDMCLDTNYFACDSKVVAIVALYLHENKEIITFEGFQPTLLDWIAILLWTTRTDHRVSFYACAKAVLTSARRGMKFGKMQEVNITADMLIFTPERADKFGQAAVDFRERAGAPRLVC